MKKKIDEVVVQSFPHRCPYCDQTISYDQSDVEEGEHPIRCPSCKRIFIKVVSVSIQGEKGK